MTKMKKLVSLMLAALMLIGMMNVAWAADATNVNKITIEKTIAGETYKIYKLFDLDVVLPSGEEGDKGSYSYEINSDWTDFFAEGGDGKQYISINDAGYVTSITDPAALAAAAAKWEDKPDALKTVVAPEATEDADSSVEFSSLEAGYYLMTSTLGTLAMADTTPDKTNVVVTEKNKEDTIYKEVQENGEWGATNDAQIGDTVNFKSTATLQPHTRNVKIHDRMDSGLTYTANSVAIEGLVKGTDYELDESPEDGDTFEIIFKDEYINKLTAETKLIITYSATLNNNAVVKEDTGVAIVDQKNKTNITYGDKQSVEDETTTTTHKFSVHKYTGENVAENEEPETWLAGAVFSLKKTGTVVPLVKIDNNNYRVAKTGETNTTDTFVTVGSGDIVIWGVDSDADYALDEINPPAGYNELAADVAVTVNANNSTHMNVVNNTGAELPSTGGIGTTIFYAVGGLLVVLAVLLLVTKRRVSEEG